MSNAILSGRALYYPYLEPNTGWLKCSLLFWDNIDRIVPKELQDRVFKGDSYDCEAARKEGLLNAVDPAFYTDGAGAQFRQIIEPIICSNEPHKRKWLARVKKELTTPIYKGKTPPWIYESKVSQNLKNDLVDAGLLKESGDWISMPNMVGGIYMSCLAAEMGGRMKIHLLTDQDALTPGSEAMLYKQDPISSPRNLEQESTLLLRLGIRFPRPEAMNNLPMKKLLKFHRDNANSRVEFRKVFDNFLAKIRSADDPNYITAIFDDERKCIEESMRKHRSDLKELGITGLNSFLKISVPAAFGTSMLTGFINQPAFNVAGVALGVAASLIDIRKQRTKQLEAHPWHYAWKVQKSFRKQQSL